MQSSKILVWWSHRLETDSQQAPLTLFKLRSTDPITDIQLFICEDSKQYDYIINNISKYIYINQVC